jgi:bifunctional N-acetylglucosamine-1-phosphate-uridyltransferase/glucosamine-1-phosphate-acetyltransferase GlmU-like protein
MEERINIVITMAGLSQRFFDAGYKVPKYMLDLNGESAFELSVKSFERYFNTNKFIFIIRDVFDTKKYIETLSRKMKIKNFEIIILDKPTKGQAESVYIGLEILKLNQITPILIFNIDTFRNNFSFPRDISTYDGYLEVFIGSGKNWSYIKPLNNVTTIVCETAEKNEISNYCSTGLYYFSSLKLYNNAYNNFTNNDNNISEKYIAPIYNHLIKNGKKIHYYLISKEDVVFCGTPQEYEQLIK